MVFALIVTITNVFINFFVKVFLRINLDIKAKLRVVWFWICHSPSSWIDLVLFKYKSMNNEVFSINSKCCFWIWSNIYQLSLNIYVKPFKSVPIFWHWNKLMVTNICSTLIHKLNGSKIDIWNSKLILNHS